MTGKEPFLTSVREDLPTELATTAFAVCPHQGIGSAIAVVPDFVARAATGAVPVVLASRGRRVVDPAPAGVLVERSA